MVCELTSVKHMSVSYICMYICMYVCICVYVIFAGAAITKYS